MKEFKIINEQNMNIPLLIIMIVIRLIGGNRRY